MKFSLVMATLNRCTEIIPLLDSLVNQSHKDFELIIIDQNDDDRIEKLCSGYPLNIRIIKNAVKGLSVNRNLGLKYISGDIIAFPDDDCEYSHVTLEKAACFFEQNLSYDFYTCNVKERTGSDSILLCNNCDAEINLDNFMTTSISFTLFIRAASIASFKFDEQLGLGAKYGSAEESDLVLFLIKNNNKGYYHAHTYIYHPRSQRSINSLISYGKGFGALHKKAITYYHFYRFLLQFFIILLKETIKLIFLFPKNERLAVIKGRLFGFFYYKVSHPYEKNFN